MARLYQKLPPKLPLEPGAAGASGEPKHSMIPPDTAWRILVLRTGVPCGLSTFYRWVSSGKVFSVRVGGRLFIPWEELEQIIRLCRAGERL